MAVCIVFTSSLKWKFVSTLFCLNVVPLFCKKKKKTHVGLLTCINLLFCFQSGFLTEYRNETFPFFSLINSSQHSNISGFIAYSLYMLHLNLPKWWWKLQPQSWWRNDKIDPPTHFLQQERHSNLKSNCPSLWRSRRSRTLRHYIPLRQRAGHLCVHKVGLELAFSLDIDDASARAHVAQSLKDAAGLLCHL